jgi:RNA polymerase sigma factor (sigma-70 family)
MEPQGAGRPLGDVRESTVRRARGGDPAALDALIGELSPYVARICGAIALDDGDDAMQETLIAVVRHLPSLREPGAIKGWVRRIAVREAVRVARRRPEAEEADGTLPAPGQDLDTTIDVRALLLRLSPDQRAVLVLRDLDGFSELEVARLLSIPEGTVKSRLHRARAAFARRWES